MDFTYVCDSTSLIDLYLHFPVEFKSLGSHAANGEIKVPEGVFRELMRKTDKISNSLEQWEKKYNIVVRLKSDPRFLSEFSRIEQTYGENVPVGGRDYPGFWKSPAGRKAADGQVVTIGMVKKWVVVSDDKAVRFACLNENVQCIGWAEFARRLSTGELQGQTNLEFQ